MNLPCIIFLYLTAVEVANEAPGSPKPRFRKRDKMIFWGRKYLRKVRTSVSYMYIVNIQIDLDFAIRGSDYLYCCLIFWCLFTASGFTMLLISPNLVSNFQAGFLILNRFTTKTKWGFSKTIGIAISLGMDWCLNIFITGATFLFWHGHLQG